MIAIYARVSTEEQAKKGFSLEDQIKECRKKAQTDDVIEYVDRGVSGEILDRLALTRLRNDVRAGMITKVICLDPDRLSRKLMNQLIITDEIEKRGVELVFVNGEYNKTPEGNLFYSMRGAIAEFEKSKINERMSRGRREKARQGKVLRNFQIYGYDYDKENGKIIINEEEAKIVRLIFDLFTKPNHMVEGINGIAKYLTSKGVPTKRGARVWHRQVIRQLLLNRVYIGEFYQNRWNTEGMLGNKFKPKEDRVPMTERPKEEWIKIECPAIIDEELFYHAQKLLGESRRRWAKKGKRKYLLSGLIRCADCKNTMVGVTSTNWGRRVFYYTDKKNYAGAKHPGCGQRIPVEKLEKEVWNAILTWLNEPNEIVAATEKEQSDLSMDFEKIEIERLENEIKKVKGGRKKLLSLFTHDLDISEEEIKQSLQDLKEKEARILKDLNELKTRMKVNKYHIYGKNLMQEAAIFYLSKGQEELTFEDKKALIRHVVKEIKVFKDHVQINTF
ncbi:recombinase family protein [Fictibacillus phosphorivorans]|uniref:recombinase family protein n=1 Tax=Fictibacillus phosphorivorans TaxID=1221500 RepID=UPI00204124B4|nr:recombinase family protein [Fictibacillus phosphorivorans]MCM3716918.1 recombinase family protein [Fictibacillus phosphorivorans]MCM3774533.1 recombinase family protein [Fictibacillus phosphorivorans]